MEELKLKLENKQPIIVLDSGLGGINIARKLHENLPEEDIVSISDLKNAPYGLKERSEILKLTNNLIKLIKNFQPKAIVLGCNTLDSVSGDKLISEFGSNKVYRIIHQTSLRATQTSENNTYAIFATKLTSEEQSYVREIIALRPGANILGISCDELATLIENGDYKNPVVDEEIKMAQGLDFDTLVLGCTHYPLIKHKFKKFYPDKTIIDCSEELVELVTRKIKISGKAASSRGSLNIISTSVAGEIPNNIEKLLTGVEYCLYEG